MPAIDQTRQSPELISLDTILILSTFLIGMSLGQVTGDDLMPDPFWPGVAGILAYLTFRMTARKRQQSQVSQERQRMEKRLERHTSQLTAPPPSQDLRRQADDIERISV